MADETPQVTHSSDEKVACELCVALDFEIGDLLRDIQSLIESLKTNLQEKFPGNDDFIESVIDDAVWENL